MTSAIEELEIIGKPAIVGEKRALPVELLTAWRDTDAVLQLEETIEHNITDPRKLSSSKTQAS